jgi:hypothetical protein
MQHFTTYRCQKDKHGNETAYTTALPFSKPLKL